MQERGLRPSSGTAQQRRCVRHRIVFLSPTSCLAANVTCRCLSALTAHEQRVPPAGALCKVDCLRNSLSISTPLRVRLLRVVCYRLIGLIVKMTKITSSAVTLRRVALTAP